MKNSVRFPHLLKINVLRDLPESFKTRFIDDCLIRSYEQSDSILTQGDKVTGMYMIAHGSVEIVSINAEGQTVLIHLSRQGEVFGDIETLADKPAAASCSAASQTVLLFAPRQMMQSAARDLTFLRNLMAVNFDRLVRDNTTKFVDQFYPVEQRLCDYLFRLSVDRPEVTKTQADLAGLLGCARQTLNRELGRLRDKAIIQMEKGKIRVLDRDALWLQATTSDPAERDRLS